MKINTFIIILFIPIVLFVNCSANKNEIASSKITEAKIAHQKSNKILAAEKYLEAFSLYEQTIPADSEEYADALSDFALYLKDIGMPHHTILINSGLTKIYTSKFDAIMEELNDFVDVNDKSEDELLDWYTRYQNICKKVACSVELSATIIGNDNQLAPFLKKDIDELYSLSKILFNDSCLVYDDKTEHLKTYINAGLYYLKTKEYNKAESFFKEGEELFNQENFLYQYYKLLFLTGVSRLLQNDTREAYLTFHALKDMCEKAHPEFNQSLLYGHILNMITNTFILLEDYEKAGYYHELAYPIFAKNQMPLDQLIKEAKIPSTIENLCLSAQLYERKGKIQKAFHIYQRTWKYLKDSIDNDWITLGNETSLLWYAWQPYFDELINFSVRNSESGEINSFLYEVIQTINTLFHPTSFCKNIDITKDKGLLQLYKKSEDTRYNADLLKRHFHNDFTTNYITLKSLAISLDVKKQMKYQKEKGLLETLSWPYTSKEVSELLDDDEIAIEFILAAPSELPDHKYYYALILTNQSPHPQAVELCHENILNSFIENSNSFFYKALYNMIWEPINSMTENYSHIYISTTEAFNNVSFAALVRDGTYLCEKHVIHNVFSLNDIVQLKNTGNQFNQIKKAYLFGDINFTIPPDELNDMRSQGFAYLPESKKEIDEISNKLSSKWEIEKFTRANASEKQFRDIIYKQQLPNVIHISTHGFYLPHIRQTEINIDNKFLAHFADPLLRTGFVLSGANEIWKKADIVDNMLDGIVTAYEISSMLLNNTELVVLSACNTGVGDIQDGGGIFGLQRAFRRAGVKSMIVSLWEVPDKETAELMTLFYSFWDSETNKRMAFNKAQQEMRSKYPKEPDKWAGFILLE